MKKKSKWGVVILLALIIIGIIVYPQLKKMSIAEDKEVSSAAPRSKGPQTLDIEAEILLPQQLIDNTIVTGSTIPDEQVDMAFESSGKIVGIFFKEGAHIQKGQLLAKINDKPLQAELQKLEAQIPLAKERVYRQHTLLQKDAVSQEAYEQVTTELDKLEADIESVKARIAQTELRAPFDGKIGLRNVSEGAYASPTTVISTLTRISPIKIEFSVPERYAGEIKEGMPIIFRLSDTEGVLKAYQATVYAVESRIDETTRSLKGRAKYPNINEEIVPGRYASVEISRRDIGEALAVPSQAIIPEMGKNIVFVYKGGKAEPREIDLGLRTEDRVQVLEGLESGDTVITTGVMQLRNGSSVKIIKLS